MRYAIPSSVMILLLFLLSGCNAGEEQAPPNVLIIFIDDMGYGDLSCYGNQVVQTPHMDALAAGGIRFTNFYVNSPICSPSRVALNTGCYPQRFGIHSYIDGSKENNRRSMNHFLDPTAPTLAKVLQENGYATGHFGKWHMGGGRDLGEVPYPAEYGYDRTLVSFEGIGDRVLFPGDWLCEQSAALGKGEITWAPKHRSTAIYVDHALEFIRSAGDEPFFINLCPNDVHDAHLPEQGSTKKWENVTGNPFKQKFYAVLEEMDRQVGRLITSWDSLGKMDHTIVILASDNGPTDWGFYYEPERYPEGYTGELEPPGFTGPLSGRKWSLYEGGIREPCIVHWKSSIRPGMIDSTTMITAMDLFPSLCSLLGVECPDQLDGTDKSRALVGKPMKKVPPVMWEYASYPGGSIQPGNAVHRAPSLAMRDGPWKLLVNTDGTDVQLYNLEQNPGETINLSTKEPGLVQHMTAELLAWRKSLYLNF
jgi:arylsulfatase A-like enzyme